MDKDIIDLITNFIFIDDNPQKSDIIFIPGSNNPLPAEKAVELYKNGYAKYLMPSGGISAKQDFFSGASEKKDIYNKIYKSECDFYCDIFFNAVIARKYILRENKARYTLQNALFSKMIIDEKSIRLNKAIICCKSYHARRCLLFYQYAFPDVCFYISTIDAYNISKNNWYTTKEGISIVLNEVEKCGKQFPLILNEDMLIKRSNN